MKIKKLVSVFGLLTAIVLLVLLFQKKENSFVKNDSLEEKQLKTSGAGKAIDMWSFERSYPGNNFSISKFQEAFQQNKLMAANRSNAIEGEWESLGPKNIGGRTLSLAFHPTNENIIYAGSASGGLWKTITEGLGEDAWEKVPTGFPVLGVASIAIDQSNPNIIVIGTGETYGEGFAEPGTVNRLTRGTYGIGILKTSDGGNTWEHVLQFNEEDIKGVQDIEINPQNSQEMYAATTDGMYQSLDGGDTWSLIFTQTNCIDIEIDPNDGDIIYVSQGNFNYALDPNLSGIFKSTDKGASFNELLDPGLISAWSGNTKLTIDPTNSNTIYASIQVGWFNTGTTTPAGIYKSLDAGATWTNINNQNIARYQGWYSHDFAVNPLNPTEMMYVGIAAWKSTVSGTNFNIKTANSWTMGEVPVDVPEGLPNYVHSDIHGVYYHPINNKIYMASDGGVFVSDDGELPYTTLNGGLQTTQFYADMGSSALTPNFCIAGAQDNASYEYKGNPSWWRVIGGDGMSASVNQDDDLIVYGSSQGLNIRKSINGGLNFFGIAPTLVTNDFTAFSAPYELAPSNQDIIYAGGTYVYKSLNAGTSWVAISNQPVDVNPIMKIAISYSNPDLLYVTTSPDPSATGSGAKILKSTDGGQNFVTVMNGLPDRICKDLEIDPNDDSILYAVFSGFGSNHAYKTIDGGSNWTAIDDGIPDVPANTILIDPLNPEDIYLGNDLGVYYSENGGINWELFSDELPEAVMIYDLNDSPSNRKIRIATHGNGIYQRNYVNDFLAVDDQDISFSEFKMFPNPASEKLNIEINSDKLFESSSIEVFNSLGQKVDTIFVGNIQSGLSRYTWDISTKVSSGTFFIRVISNGSSVLTKTLLIN